MNNGNPYQVITYSSFSRNYLAIRNFKGIEKETTIYRTNNGDRIHSIEFHPTKPYVSIILSRLSSVRRGDRIIRVASIFVIALAVSESASNETLQCRQTGFFQLEATPDVPTQLPYLRFESSLAFVDDILVAHARRSLNFSIIELMRDGSLITLSRLELAFSWRPCTEADLLQAAFIATLPALQPAFRALWETMGTKQMVHCWLPCAQQTFTRPNTLPKFISLFRNIPFFAQSLPHFLDSFRTEQFYYPLRIDFRMAISVDG